jgi:hypothetical protein
MASRACRRFARSLEMTTHSSATIPGLIAGPKPVTELSAVPGPIAEPSGCAASSSATRERWPASASSSSSEARIVPTSPSGTLDRWGAAG